MKQLSPLTLLSRIFSSLFTALSLSLFILLASPFSGKLCAAAEQDPYNRELLASLSLGGPQHGFTQFPVHDGAHAHVDDLDLPGEVNHDKSLLEKGWDWYYSVPPVAQKAAPTTRGMSTVWHYGQQLLASGKRKAQKFGPNQDEVAALKLGINIEWPNSTLHDQDRACYLQEALHSISQIQQEYETRQTTPLSHYVSERITDLTYFLAFTVDKSKPYYQRKRVLDSIQKTHAQSHLLDFDIPKLNQTGADLIPLYAQKLAKEESTAGKNPNRQAQAGLDGEHEDELAISSASDGDDGERANRHQSRYGQEAQLCEHKEEKRQ